MSGAGVGRHRDRYLFNMTCSARRGVVVLNVCSANYGWPVELHSYPGFFPLSQFKLFSFVAYSRGSCKPCPRNVDFLKLGTVF